MELQNLVNYCQSLEGAIIGFPFGDKPVCFKRNDRIFAEIWPDPADYKLTLRCDPAKGETLRQAHPGIILTGYHVPLRQRHHKITVKLDKGLDGDFIKELVTDSWESAGKTRKR
jgi:predicted DNA-binding protein (MmcQ/YjbR family)